MCHGLGLGPRGPHQDPPCYFFAPAQQRDRQHGRWKRLEPAGPGGLLCRRQSGPRTGGRLVGGGLEPLPGQQGTPKCRARL